MFGGAETGAGRRRPVPVDIPSTVGCWTLTTSNTRTQTVEPPDWRVQQSAIRHPYLVNSGYASICASALNAPLGKPRHTPIALNTVASRSVDGQESLFPCGIIIQAALLAEHRGPLDQRPDICFERPKIAKKKRGIHTTCPKESSHRVDSPATVFLSIAIHVLHGCFLSWLTGVGESLLSRFAVDHHTTRLHVANSALTLRLVPSCALVVLDEFLLRTIIAPNLAARPQRPLHYGRGCRQLDACTQESDGFC